MSLGKALGGGVPIGAILLSQAVADAVSPGDHGTTYGGNLLACRAALVFLEFLTQGGLQRVHETGSRLAAGLDTLAERYPLIGDVRGAGLMRGLEMPADAAAQVVDAAMSRGLLVNRTAGTVVRMLPPLTVTDSEVDKALGILDDSLATLS
jgi:acetylornithine/succinyldiaminopimelate/putrescine aminotransferase